MKLNITGLLLFLAFGLFGQTVRTVGVVYTASAPVHTPSGQGAWIAVDTTSGSWYEWERTTGVWRDAGYRIQLTNTTGVPNYTPSKARGRVALNSGDSLYAYQAGAWACLNCVVAPDLSGYVEYSDSNTIYITPDQLSDSLSALPDSIMSGYGVANYLPQYATASTLGTTGLYWDGAAGRLGVGTIPQSFVEMVSSNSSEVKLVLRNNFTTPGNPRKSTISLQNGNATYEGIFQYDPPNGYFTIGSVTNDNLRFITFNTERIRILNTGRVGIGQTTPTARLHITGEGTTNLTTALLVDKSNGDDIIKANDGGAVTIGPGANTSGAVLDVQSTTGVFAPPRMTTAQRDALTPPTGGIIFCTDCTATDGSTGVSQTYSSGTWKNHY